MYRRILALYGEHCMAQKHIYEWVDKFKHRKTNLDDEEHSGRPSKSRKDGHSAASDYHTFGSLKEALHG
jgi:hypothetical protein